MESNNSEYFFLYLKDYDKFDAAMSKYDLWNEVQDYLDKNYLIRMDDYLRIIKIRLEMQNDVYKNLDLGFLEADYELTERLKYIKLKILDEKKWGYFKIKAEL